MAKSAGAILEELREQRMAAHREEQAKAAASQQRYETLKATLEALARDETRIVIVGQAPGHLRIFDRNRAQGDPVAELAQGTDGNVAVMATMPLLSGGGSTSKTVKLSDTDEVLRIILRALISAGTVAG